MKFKFDLTGSKRKREREEMKELINRTWATGILMNIQALGQLKDKLDPEKNPQMKRFLSGPNDDRRGLIIGGVIAAGLGTLALVSGWPAAVFLILAGGGTQCALYGIIENYRDSKPDADMNRQLHKGALDHIDNRIRYLHDQERKKSKLNQLAGQFRTERKQAMDNSLRKSMQFAANFKGANTNPLYEEAKVSATVFPAFGPKFK